MTNENISIADSQNIKITNNPKIKKLLLIVIFTIIIFLISGLTIGLYFWQKQNTPENVIKNYLTKTQKFDGLDEQITAIKVKVNFSEGFFKNLWETQLFMTEKNITFLNRELDQIGNLKKLNLSQEYIKYLNKKIENIIDKKTNLHQDINNVSIKTLEKDKNTAKVEVTYEIENKSRNSEQKISQSGIYLLNRFQRQWKIVDFTDKDGVWSKNIDNNKIKSDFINSLDVKEKMFDQSVSMMNSKIKQNMEIEVIDEQLGALGNVVWKEDFTSGQNWTGKDSQTSIILVDSSNAVARITGKPNSDGFLYKRIAVPYNTYYMSFEYKNETNSADSFLTLATDKQVLDYQPINKTTDKMEKSNEIFIGDYEGKQILLLFTVNVVGKQNPSVLIDNIKFYENLPSLPND